jgi:hypothetical protein
MPELQQKHELLKLKRVPVRQLLLDPENPRLEGIAKSTEQDELLRAMWREMAVSEVALSIAENGYFEEEPLFVIPAPPVNGEPRFYVVEGNRRLTAVKLLLDSRLRSRLKATDLPTISETRRDELQKLPVSVYKDHEALWEFFGFRHVNGPKEWDSLSKAAYIAKVRRQYRKSLDEIARKIGDQHSTVERIYRGYMLLEQAETKTDFSRADRMRNRFYFSHLYTAAGYPEVLAFLGTDPNRSITENPVPKRHLPQLEELMTWLFGSKQRAKEPAVRTQAPDLRYLRSIIGDKQALAALRSGLSLERSYSISLGDTRRFEKALAETKDALQEVKGTVTTGFKGDPDLLNQMESITVLANSVLSEMRDIVEGKKKK